MGIKIMTTGLEQFAPGGEARLQMMIVGSGDTGKSRLSSYAPKPLFAACERGVASIADRGTAYVPIHTTQDMADFLAYAKTESRLPDARRKFQTIVIDTIDAYARTVKKEYQDANPAPKSKYDMWTFIEQKLQDVLVDLLHLDLSVLVLAHPEVKKYADPENPERVIVETSIALQGKTQGNVFNDFDAVSWLESHWGMESGKRVEKRRLTFRKSPQLPFLKDKLSLSADREWIDVRFEDGIWETLFAPLRARVAAMQPVTELGEIPSTAGDPIAPPNAFVVPVSAAKSGPVPPQREAPAGLVGMDKTALFQYAVKLGLKPKGNTTKGELQAMIVAKELEAAGALLAAEEPTGLAVLEVPAKASEPVAVPTDAAPREPDVTATPSAAQIALQRHNPKGLEEVKEIGDDRVAGLVNVSTGEIVQQEAPRTQEEAVAVVVDVLGGAVVADETPDSPAAPATVPAVVAGKYACQGCDGPVDIAWDSTDAKKARLRFKAVLCSTCIPVWVAERRKPLPDKIWETSL